MAVIPTVTIDLGDGDNAEVLKEMKHLTARLLQANLRKYLIPMGGPLKLSELTAETKVVEDFVIDRANFDQDQQNHITLLNQVVKWSFGEITEAVIDNMPKRKYDLLVSEVDKLYSAAPLPGSAAKS